jgi:hypothetical protein
VSDTGDKNPMHHQPTHGKDTVIKTSEESSKNHEYDQHRIDSIKNSKPNHPYVKRKRRLIDVQLYLIELIILKVIIDFINALEM